MSLFNVFQATGSSCCSTRCQDAGDGAVHDLPAAGVAIADTGLQKEFIGRPALVRQAIACCDAASTRPFPSQRAMQTACRWALPIGRRTVLAAMIGHGEASLVALTGR